MWWLFAQLYKNSKDCFVFEFLTVNTLRVDFKIESVLLEARRKKIKFLFINEEMGTTTVDSQ